MARPPRPDIRQAETLGVIKSLVAAGDYHLSGKVQGQIEEGVFGTDDLEACIMTATLIQKSEQDELRDATDGHKHTILGRDSRGVPFYTCGKIILTDEDHRLYFFITAHERR